MAHLVDSVGLSWSLQGIICSATTQRLCWTIGKLDEGGFKGKIKQKNLPGRNPALPQLIKKNPPALFVPRPFLPLQMIGSVQVWGNLENMRCFADLYPL